MVSREYGPIACGIAKYYKLKSQKNISVVFIGDGTLERVLFMKHLI